MLYSTFNTIGSTPATCKFARLIVEKVLGKVGTTHRKLESGGTHKSWTKVTNPKEPTLFLGVDVLHPRTRDLKDPESDVKKMSVATVVGNIDIDCTEYRALSKIQSVGEEKIDRFQDEIQTRIRPAHIVVYRDGRLEGDFQRTLYEERIAIENACIASLSTSNGRNVKYSTPRPPIHSFIASVICSIYLPRGPINMLELDTFFNGLGTHLWEKKDATELSRHYSISCIRSSCFPSCPWTPLLPISVPCVPTMRIFCLVETTLAIVALALTNVGLGIFTSAVVVPVVFQMTYESYQRERSIFRSGMLAILSPMAVLTMVAYSLPAFITVIIPDKAYQTVLGVPVFMLRTMIQTGVANGSWHLYLITCVAWPVWNMIYASSLRYDLEIDRANMTPPPTPAPSLASTAAGTPEDPPAREYGQRT